MQNKSNEGDILHNLRNTFHISNELFIIPLIKLYIAYAQRITRLGGIYLIRACFVFLYISKGSVGINYTSVFEPKTAGVNATSLTTELDAVLDKNDNGSFLGDLQVTDDPQKSAVTFTGRFI